MRIIVENLSEKTTTADLRDLFSEYGQIVRVGLAKAKSGYGLVEMKDDSEGERAIAALRGFLLRERPLKVRQTRMRPDRNTTNDNNS